MMKYEDFFLESSKIPFPAITFNNELEFEDDFNGFFNYLLYEDSPPIEEVIQIFGDDR